MCHGDVSACFLGPLCVSMCVVSVKDGDARVWCCGMWMCVLGCMMLCDVQISWGRGEDHVFIWGVGSRKCLVGIFVCGLRWQF